ncbi:MAG: hypothetical protein IJE43_03560 [Alphaproteobacteria bacterium]|nr:hypothetical protein [Alphaproteobacteria bacterium]
MTGAADKPFVTTDVNRLQEVVAVTGELFELYNALLYAKGWCAHYDSI